MTGTATLKTANRHVFCNYAVLTISYYFWTQSLLIRVSNVDRSVMVVIICDKWGEQFDDKSVCFMCH